MEEDHFWSESGESEQQGEQSKYASCCVTNLAEKLNRSQTDTIEDDKPGQTAYRKSKRRDGLQPDATLDRTNNKFRYGLNDYLSNHS